jgi:hypothetical protein
VDAVDIRLDRRTYSALGWYGLGVVVAAECWRKQKVSLLWSLKYGLVGLFTGCVLRIGFKERAEAIPKGCNKLWTVGMTGGGGRWKAEMPWPGHDEYNGAAVSL